MGKTVLRFALERQRSAPIGTTGRRSSANLNAFFYRIVRLLSAVPHDGFLLVSGLPHHIAMWPTRIVATGVDERFNPIP